MKIRKLAALCKAAKTIYLINDNISGVQWCGCGEALYPLRGLPRMDESQIMRLFDIPSADSDKYQVYRDVYTACPIDTRDIPRGEENILPPPDICITYAGQEFMPLSASGKVIWINPKYIDPVSKSGDIELYERVDGRELSYIAVKVGMMLEAIIYPLSVGDKLPGRLKQLGNAVHYIDPRTGEVSG